MKTMQIIGLKGVVVGREVNVSGPLHSVNMSLQYKRKLKIVDSEWQKGCWTNKEHIRDIVKQNEKCGYFA